MTDPAEADDPTMPFKSRAGRWLFTQGASTVLLFILVLGLGYGAWYGVPKALDQIQKGYDLLDARHASERKEVREDAKAERSETREAIKELRSALEKLNDKLDKR